MPFWVVWQMGDGKHIGPKQEREWATRKRAMAHYEELVRNSLTEWASVVNRTYKSEQVLAKWDCEHGEVSVALGKDDIEGVADLSHVAKTPQ